MYLLIVLFLFLSYFFSGTETGFTSLNVGRLRLEAENGDKKKQATYELSKRFSDVLYTILIGNNLVNIGISSITTLIALKIIEDTNSSWPIQAIATVIITLLILIFGEITPKLIANENPNHFAQRATPFIKFFIFLFKPIVLPVTKMVDKMSKIWKPKTYLPTLTEDELITIVETMEEEGGFTEQESDLIKSAIEFSADLAFEILTPRVDVFAVDIDQDPVKIVEQVFEEEYSRVPVYKGNIDNIVGILSTKLLVKAAVKHKNITDIKSMMKEPLFIHKSMSISDIMEEFKQKRAHMAIVVDEFGGTMGIVTLEDVLEQLVGDIWDETDEPNFDKIETTSGIYIIAGDMLLDDFFDIIEYNDKDFDSEYTTVGGFATEVLGHFPQNNESFEFNNYIITVIEAQNMRVEKLKVEVKENVDE